MVGLFLSVIVLSGCAAQPIATVAPIAPTSPRFVVVSKIPAPTLSASQVTPTSISTIIPASPVSIPTYIPPTVAPTITASDPTLVPNTVNAQAFNKNAPGVIGPFKRVATQTVTSGNGATMQFRTSDGTLYQVVLWMLPSAQDALTHYQVETSQISAKQPLKVGDEGIIAAAGPILAEVRYRNTVLIVYRPTAKSAVTPMPLTNDEITSFVSALLKAVPPS